MIAIHVINNNTPYLQSVTITTPPTKTAYYVGERFDPSGMILTGTYKKTDNSTYTRIISDYMFNQGTFPLIALGATSVDITVYDETNNYTISQPITVSVDTFSNCSWATIQQISQSGRASEFFNIGDYKIANVNNIPYKMVIVDFDHDNVSIPGVYGRTKAGITLQLGLTNAGEEPEYYNATYQTWSELWNESGMRTFELATMLTLLDQELQDVIVPVTKIYDAGSTSSSMNMLTVSDGLFLPASQEIIGNNILYSYSGMGTQYEYFIGKSWSAGTDQLTRSKHCDTTALCILRGTNEYIVSAGSNGKIKPMFCI